MLGLGWRLCVALAAMSGLPSTTPVDPSCPCIWFDGYGQQNNGSFMSPDWPRPYDPDIRCLLYTFVGAANELVELTFFSLHLGRRDAEGRCSDWLRLFLQVGKDGLDGVNESSQWEVELCGSQASSSSPLHFWSASSMLVMEFHSDDKQDHLTDRGFMGEFRFLDKRHYATDGRLIGQPCDYRISSLHDTKVGQLFSPRFPYHYPSNTHCVFYLEGRPDEVVKIKLKTVDLPPVDGSCISATNTVYVFDGKRPYHTAKPRHAVSTRLRRRRLRHSRPHRRFTSSSTAPLPSSSASFPSSPPSLLRSRRSLLSSSETSVPGPNLIGEYCGKREREDLLITSGPLATIEFHSEDNHRLLGRGFHAEYEFVPASEGAPIPPTIFGPHATDWPHIFSKGRKCEYDISSTDSMQGGVISSPNYPNPYPADLKVRLSLSQSLRLGEEGSPFQCTYTFRSNSKQRVQLIFKDFDLYLGPGQAAEVGAATAGGGGAAGEKTTKCRGEMDHFSAYVELEGRMSEVDTFCGGAETPPQLMSAKTILTAEFITHFHPTAPQGHSRRGFKFVYKFVEDFGISTGQRDPRHVCGFVYNASQATNGTIYSPNYPGYYPRATDCHYEFHAPPNHHVRIFFTYFDVEGYANCDNDSQSDYVLFSNYRTKDRKNQRFCGLRRPNVQESELNFFRMIFHSNSIFDGTGFYALYQFASKTKPPITSVKVTKSSAPPSPLPSQHSSLVAVLLPLLLL